MSFQDSGKDDRYGRTMGSSLIQGRCQLDVTFSYRSGLNLSEPKYDADETADFLFFRIGNLWIDCVSLPSFARSAKAACSYPGSRHSFLAIRTRRVVQIGSEQKRIRLCAFWKLQSSG
jgi:hypothetical protein